MSYLKSMFNVNSRKYKVNQAFVFTACLKMNVNSKFNTESVLKKKTDPLHRKSYMSSQVVLNLLDKLVKNKMECCAEHLISFPKTNLVVAAKILQEALCKSWNFSSMFLHHTMNIKKSNFNS